MSAGYVIAQLKITNPKIIKKAVNMYLVIIYGTNQVSLLFSKLNFALR